MKKSLTKSERMTKLYVKFYKQTRALYVKQFRELAEFHQIEDRQKLEKKIKKPHDNSQPHPSTNLPTVP